MRVDRAIAICPLAARAAPFGCDWCGRPQPRFQRRWCSALCARAFIKNHLWKEARAAALKRDGYACVRCGRHSDLEVNHIVPLAFSLKSADGRYNLSCLHHLSGLETLCRPHHLEATAQQRADGLIGKRKKKR